MATISTYNCFDDLPLELRESLRFFVGVHVPPVADHPLHLWCRTYRVDGASITVLDAVIDASERHGGPRRYTHYPECTYAGHPWFVRPLDDHELKQFSNSGASPEWAGGPI